MTGPAHDREPLSALPLDYEPPQRSKSRPWVVIALCLALAVVLLMGIAFFGFLGVRRTVRVVPAPAITMSGRTNTPTLLTPSRAQMADETLPAEGVELTLKQRERRWLPGGEMELALDDITGGRCW